MEIAIYLAIIISTVAQSASTKAFNRHSTSSSVFNAIKAFAALVMFALMAVAGFTFHAPTLLFGLLYGASLCLSMYAGYRALCLGPMALTSMLVSFSIIVPLLWGITFANEQPTKLQTVALFMLFGAILLTNLDKILGNRGGASAKKGSYGLWLFFVATTFLCNGCGSVLQKQYKALYSEAYNDEFMFFAMLLCTVIYVTIAVAKNSLADVRAVKNKWLGALAGVTNGLASFFTLLLAGLENASILFPIISAGTLLGSLLCGRFIFRERLKLNHYAALTLGIFAVVFLKM